MRSTSRALERFAQKFYDASSPCHSHAVNLRTSCYRLSWRDLRRRPNAGFGLLHKPEITPPSNSNQSYYATPHV